MFLVKFRYIYIRGDLVRLNFRLRLLDSVRLLAMLLVDALIQVVLGDLDLFLQFALDIGYVFLYSAREGMY